jgi:NAD(P)-dependent dehydrogenase (short-subunit alcohol dehydrogenase family)
VGWGDFGGRVAVITGSAQGIGEAVARAFAQRKAHVIIADLNGAGAAQVADSLRRSGLAADAATVDVMRADSIEAAVHTVVNDLGRVDILVNAAGGFPKAVGAEEITDAEWRQIIDLNLTSTFLCCRSVIPVMRSARYGRIVNVASEAGRMPITLSAAHYAAAKAGVLGLTRHLARELGPHGITVNAVAPGTTLTPRVAALRAQESLEWITRLTPLGRIADVDDQVGPIMFLASDAARYITGATLDVTGGRLML